MRLAHARRAEAAPDLFNPVCLHGKAAGAAAPAPRPGLSFFSLNVFPISPPFACAARRPGLPPQHPAQGAAPLDPASQAASVRALAAHAHLSLGGRSRKRADSVIPAGLSRHARQTLSLLPASFAGGVQGEGARVPLVGGAGAKRPAKDPNNQGVGQSAPQKTQTTRGVGEAPRKCRREQKPLSRAPQATKRLCQCAQFLMRWCEPGQGRAGLVELGRGEPATRDDH